MSKNKLNQEPEKEYFTETEDAMDQPHGTDCPEDPEYCACDSMSGEEGTTDDNSASLAEEAALWKDRFVRLSAEFDNYRKRTLKEKMEMVATAGEDVLKSLLPVLDDLDRAMAILENDGVTDSFAEGIIIIYNKLKETLRSKGLSEIKSIGEPLDTDLHDAVAKVPVGKKEKGIIVDVAQKGYTLNNKVIRHAKVIVGE